MCFFLQFSCQRQLVINLIVLLALNIKRFSYNKKEGLNPGWNWPDPNLNLEKKKKSGTEFCTTDQCNHDVNGKNNLKKSIYLKQWHFIQAFVNNIGKKTYIWTRIHPYRKPDPGPSS